MSINKGDITREMLAKALTCQTAEDLMALAKAEGCEISKDEAEAYLAEMDDFELNDTELKQIAGGAIYERCNDHCYTLDGCGALT